MAGPDFIPRERPDPDGLEYGALKRQGLGLTQGLSGDIWTDYNEHDPGVTIIEQLSFGLTDLAYRSGLPVTDYLCDAKGNIDCDGQALFRPQDILPSRPVTANDYRKLLYDAIPDIEDVWLRPRRGRGSHVDGLYTIFVKLDSQHGAQPMDEAESARRGAEVSRQVRQVFCAQRNLCEDIDAIHIVKTSRVYLSGEIEVRGKAPSKVFADIFFQCARLLSSALRVERYEDALASGRNYEDLFDGPLTGHGHIDDQSPGETRKSISVVKLIGAIRLIEGVAQVRNFILRDENGQPIDDLSCDPGQENFPELWFPDSTERQNYLRMVASSGARRGSDTSGMLAIEADNEKPQALLESARLELRKLYFGFRALRNAGDAVGRLLPIPRGMPHDLAAYYSIQNQFPAIYGINRYGIPRSASEKRKAQGRQLKAYLYPFEQVMANYLKTLDGMAELFSLDTHLTQSYFSQVLDNKSIPAIEELRTEEPTRHAQSVVEIRAAYDDASERRSRALDAMLAIYGEEFPSAPFFLHDEYRSGDALQWLNESKIAYLKALPVLGRDRNGALDYLAAIDAPENISGLEKKVGLLLGMDDCLHWRSLTGEILRQKIVLRNDVSPEGDDKTEESAMPVCALPDDDREAAKALNLVNGVIPKSMFRHGVKLENFVLQPSGKQIAVGFRRAPGQTLWLAACDDMRQATLFAHHFRNALVLLNRQCEGMHLVEHLLLRPQGKDVSRHEGIEVAADFYAYRVSIVLPAWTARFANAAFRDILEETVCRNLAAHVFPEFLWLDFADMHLFEQYHKTWRHSLRTHGTSGADTDARAVNAASVKLIAFLQMKNARATRQYWV